MASSRSCPKDIGNGLGRDETSRQPVNKQPATGRPDVALSQHQPESLVRREGDIVDVVVVAQVGGNGIVGIEQARVVGGGASI
jgi:hypothetical protein